jgi:DNA-binding HxlR family transcriptional regulator
MYRPIESFWITMKGKYKADILIYLNDRSLRYSDLRKKFSDASERILIKQLKELERSGLLDKQLSGAKPPFRSEYRISSYGRSVCPILKQMWAWGENHMRIING